MDWNFWNSVNFVWNNYFCGWFDCGYYFWWIWEFFFVWFWLWYYWRWAIDRFWYFWNFNYWWWTIDWLWYYWNFDLSWWTIDWFWNFDLSWWSVDSLWNNFCWRENCWWIWEFFLFDNWWENNLKNILGYFYNLPNQQWTNGSCLTQPINPLHEYEK